MKKKISQNISSRSLFHFVRKIEYLIDILNNGFQARFCFEQSPLGKLQVAVPMKCFCDIPLGMIKKHINRYGKFGIGVTKEFAKDAGISPVLYVHDKATTLRTFVNEYIATPQSQQSGKPSLYAYFKNFEGIEVVDGKEERVNYYDEREWRFIPNNMPCIPEYHFRDLNIPKNQLETHEKVLNNNLPPQCRIPLPKKDISYLFVKSETDIQKVVNEIRAIKSNPEQQDLLIAKIITAKQIQGDF